jgi:hypothetical protein
MDKLPIWLEGLALFVALLLMTEAGYRIDGVLRRLRGIPDGGGATSGGRSMLVSGALSMLGLLLAFTVSMANERYQSRRQLVVAEANAIATTYLRAQVLSEPGRSRMSGLIAHYAEERRTILASEDASAKVRQAEAAAYADEQAVWAETVETVRQPANLPFATSFLQAVNPMVDLSASRQASLETRVPPRILLVVTINSLVTAALVGYGLAAGANRHLMASTLVFLLVTLTVVLVLDLDRTESGGIRVSQAPLERVAAAISAFEAAKRPAAAAPPNH